MTDGTVRRPNGKLATIELVTRPVAELGCLVDNLIKGRENVVSELHLSDGGSSSRRSSNCKTSDTLL